MPTITDNAVCIRRWDFSETSQTVGLFTREHGVIRGLAKGAKRERGSFSGGIDVLTRGQIVAIVKPGRDLATLTQWSLEEVFWAIRRDLHANRAGLYMADLIYRMAGEPDPHPLLFDAFVSALRKLEQPEDIDYALLTFQWILLCETGYKPDLNTALDQTDVVLFSPTAGGVVNSSKDGPAPGGRGTEHRAQSTGNVWRVRGETIELLRSLDAGRSVLGTQRSATVVDRANRLLAAYIREILGSEAPTLTWVFPDLSV